MTETAHPNTSETGWWADCCSTVHITNGTNAYDLIDLQPWREPVKLKTGLGGGINISYSTHRGTATTHGI